MAHSFHLSFSKGFLTPLPPKVTNRHSRGIMAKRSERSREKGTESWEETEMGEGRDPERGGQGTETSERGRLACGSRQYVSPAGL